MKTHKNEQNIKNNAIANQTENNNSDIGLSLTPPDINFSTEILQEQVDELLQFKENEIEEKSNFLKNFYSKNQDNYPIQHKPTDNISNENFGNTKQPENFVRKMQNVFQFKEDSRKDIPNFLQVWNKNQDKSPIQQKTTTENISNTSENTKQPENFMKQMENSFQTDFSDVNIHKNSRTAENLGALAFTQGNNVHFAPGQFKPDTNQGKELIGHEFAHVVQQRQGKVQPNKQIGKFKINDNSALEKQADEMGKKAANNQVVSKNQLANNSISDVVQMQYLSFENYEKYKGKDDKPNLIDILATHVKLDNCQTLLRVSDS